MLRRGLYLNHVLGGMNQDERIIRGLNRKKRLSIRPKKTESMEYYAIKINGEEKNFYGSKILVCCPEITMKISKKLLPQIPIHTVIIKNRKNSTQAVYSKRETRACSNKNYRANCLRTFARRKELRKISSPNIKLMSQIMAAKIEGFIENF